MAMDLNQAIKKTQNYTAAEWFTDRDSSGKLTEDAKFEIEKLKPEGVRREHYVSKEAKKKQEEAYVSLDSQEILKKKPKGKGWF